MIGSGASSGPRTSLLTLICRARLRDNHRSAHSFARDRVNSEPKGRNT